MKRAILGALLVALAGCTTIDTGHRGVVLNYSKPSGEVKGEGFTWYNPLSTHIEQMSVQTQADEVKAAAASKDLQHVDTVVTVNYNLDPARVVDVYEKLRQDYEQRVINPTVQDSLKAATANFQATDLIANREAVRTQIERDLRTRLDPYGIHVDQVLITDFSFTSQFDKAVESKVAAQQDQQTATIEAKTKQIRAEGDAKSQSAQHNSLTPALLQKEALDNQRTAIDKWDGKMPDYVAGQLPMITVPSK